MSTKDSQSSQVQAKTKKRLRLTACTCTESHPRPTPVCRSLISAAGTLDLSLLTTRSRPRKLQPEILFGHQLFQGKSRGGQLALQDPYFVLPRSSACHFSFHNLTLFQQVHILISRSMMSAGNVQQISMDELRPQDGPVVWS